jgi:predicted DNA-binding transcriptional regulator AlpA
VQVSRLFDISTDQGSETLALSCTEELRVLIGTSGGAIQPGHIDTLLELEPLLTAAEVGRILGVRAKRVYELGIPAVRLSEKCLRWRPSAVQAWLDSRSEGGVR